MIIFFYYVLINALQEPIEVPFLKEPPTIDGIISADEWIGADVLSGFFTQFYPDFGKKINENTIVRIGCNKSSLCLLFEVYQDISTFIEKKGLRDEVFDQDAIGVVIDPLGNKQEIYCIIFGLSGTLRDFRQFRAKVNSGEDHSWNCDVDFVVQKTDSGYTVEVQIPFGNFRCSGKDEAIWNINFYRKIQSANCQATYVPYKDLSREADYETNIPFLFRNIDESWKTNITPYGLYSSLFDTLTTERSDVGFDMKIPVYTTGVANFAFNPDFSQLEGDPLEFDFYNQYALYFAEYRPFFIEESGVFQTDSEIYYSRKIQNPFLAGRYTYKEKNNQAGIIFSYDEEDTIIKNTEALASVLRYTRQYGQNNAGAMILDRYDLSSHNNNLALMTDGNFYFPYNTKLTYRLAGTGINNGSSSDIFSNDGFYYRWLLSYETIDWIISGSFLGHSPYFANDLGFVQEVNNNCAGGYIGRRFFFGNNILKQILLVEDFNFSGSWSRFDNYIMSTRDSIEYLADTKATVNLFSSSLIFFRYRMQKEFWQSYYLERWKYDTYAESKINDYISVDGGFSGGYLIDFNIVSVGEFNSGYGDISISPFPELTINSGASFTIFDTDTTHQALRPPDVRNPVYTWRTFSINGGIGYSPINNLSVKLVIERQAAHFAPGYYDINEYEISDNKIFGVIEYNPSIGNTIYLGGRYPEKMVFFKFTHRFIL